MENDGENIFVWFQHHLKSMNAEKLLASRQDLPTFSVFFTRTPGATKPRRHMIMVGLIG